MQTLLQNKKARLNFEIQKTYQAGMSLFGYEVKSLRQKKGDLEGSHISVRGGEAYLLNMHIPPYQPSNTPESYDTYRNRKLLLTKKEIEEISVSESQKGLTIVPLSVYNAGSKIKVEIAVARGKKKYDKREDIKRRDVTRDIERTLKRN